MLCPPSNSRFVPRSDFGRLDDRKMLAVCGLALDAGQRYGATLRALLLGVDRQVATLEDSDRGKGHRVPAPLVVCSACGICSVPPTLRCCRFTRKVDRDKLPMRQNG
jgi:hypothetical protein